MDWGVVLGLSVSFVSVFLRGFQHQNVIGGQYKLAFAFSYLMAATDVVVVGLVAVNGYAMIIPIGTGSAMGIVSSMRVYRKYLRRKTE